MTSPLSTQAVLLTELERKFASGAEIIERINQRVALKLSAGSVYPALLNMEGERLIKRKLVRGGRRSSEGRALYFELTAKGRRQARLNRMLIESLVLWERQLAESVLLR
jgi:DNA-binding PadR family transcriptional regulator